MDAVITKTQAARHTKTLPVDFADAGDKNWLSWIDTILERCITWLIAILLVCSIAFMGGRYDWGWLAWNELAFVGVVTLAMSLWLLRLAIRPQLGLVFSWSIVLLAAGALIGILQLVSMPQWLLQICSPGFPSILPLWWDNGAGTEVLGAWTCASLMPHRTAEALRYFALYSLTFLLVIQNVRTLNSVRRFMLLIYCVGIATAIFGLIQYLSWNEKFFWFFEIPWVPNNNCCRGPFTNKNHFAGLLAMVVGPGFYFLLSGFGQLRRTRSASKKGRDYLLPISCFALGCLMLAAFLSLSRGGIIATALAFAVAAGGLTFFIQSQKIWLFILILTCTIFAGFLSYAGTEQIENRLATIEIQHECADGSFKLDDRLELWRALLNTVPDFPVLGTGFGTHQFVYQLYYGKDPEICYTHAENSYLQLLTEGGILTAALVVLAFSCLAYWCITSLRATTCPDAKPCLVAIMAALAAAAFHGAVDFVWYIPSHALLLAVLAGLLCALARVQNPGKTSALPNPSRSWLGPVLLACPLVFTVWLQMSFHNAKAAILWTEFQQSADGEYADKNTSVSKTYDETRLQEALQNRPGDPRLHSALGDLALHKFIESKEYKATAMPLGQLAQAVENSHFETPEKRNRWLDGTFGPDNRKLLETATAHYLQAIRAYPLHTPSYLHLAELHFLAEPATPSIRSLLNQAMKANPSDPNMTYEMGRQFLQMEDTVQAMACWRQCAMTSEKHKQTILGQLCAAVPLATLIEQFKPDYTSMIWLCQQRFGGTEQRKERLYLLSQAQKVTLMERDPKVVGPHMCELHTLLMKDGNQEQALECARTAVAAEPYLCSNRLRLANALFQQGKFNESKKELEWCAMREPGNHEVQALRSAVFDAINNNRKPAPPMTPAPTESSAKTPVSQP